MADLLDRLRTALADRYRVERELGAGGMATVYLARDLKLERAVAIKVQPDRLAKPVGRQERGAYSTSACEGPCPERDERSGAPLYLRPWWRLQILCVHLLCVGEPMNLTLAIDDELLREARKVAQAMGKSVNQLIREYLEQITRRDDPGRDAQEFRRLSLEGRGRSNGRRWTRDELHERS